MTVIRPNSVSGITSITAQANDINFFRSNGTLAGLNLNGVNFNTTSGVSTFAALNIEGVLTYQDVTNVDSIGIITARSTIDAQGAINLADSIIHSGDTNTKIRFPSADTISFETAGSERLNIASNGDVTITNTSSNPQLALISANDGISEIQFGDGNDSVRGNIVYRSGSAGDALCFNGYNNTERLRIDSAGRVMIGTTTEGNVNADDLTIANSGEGGITIRSGSSSNGNIFFSDATSGAGEYAGIIDYKHSSNVMTFGISGTERLRITEGSAEQATLVIDNAQTNGNTWIGDNYTANATEHTCTIGNMYSGAGLFFGYNMKPKSDSWGFVSTQDAYSDRRAGMTLNGSGYDALRIDVTNANQQITTGDDVTTIKAFAVKHNGDVEIPDGNLVVASGHGIDFSATGNSSGSMTAELFDDYEEGTFVPGTPSYSSTGATGQYTKIGNTVHYQIQIQGISGSASFIISNLPFAVHAGWGGTIGITNHGGQDHFYPFPHQGMSQMYVRNSSNSTYNTVSSAIQGKFFYIWGTYITNA